MSVAPSTDVLHAFRGWLLERDYAPSTVRTLLANVRQVIRATGTHEPSPEAVSAFELTRTNALDVRFAWARFVEYCLQRTAYRPGQVTPGTVRTPEDPPRVVMGALYQIGLTLPREILPRLRWEHVTPTSIRVAGTEYVLRKEDHAALSALKAWAAPSAGNVPLVPAGPGLMAPMPRSQLRRILRDYPVLPPPSIQAPASTTPATGGVARTSNPQLPYLAFQGFRGLEFLPPSGDPDEDRRRRTRVFSTLGERYSEWLRWGRVFADLKRAQDENKAHLADLRTVVATIPETLRRRLRDVLCEAEDAFVRSPGHPVLPGPPEAARRLPMAATGWTMPSVEVLFPELFAPQRVGPSRAGTPAAAVQVKAAVPASVPRTAVPDGSLKETRLAAFRKGWREKSELKAIAEMEKRLGEGEER